MAKEEVKQAIDETIVANGKRGITGQSLANVLHMMVDEGGSGGGVYVVRLGSFGVDTLVQSAEDRAHNKQIFELIKASVQNKSISFPMIALDYAELMPELTMYFEQFKMAYMLPCTGYIDSVQLQAVIGYKEFAFVTGGIDGDLSDGIVLLPDGTIILGSIL